MTREAIGDVISYIFRNMSILAGDLTRLETDLHSALAKETVQTSPEINRVFSGYVSTITRYAAVMTQVSKMLGTAISGQDSCTQAEQQGLKQ